MKLYKNSSNEIEIASRYKQHYLFTGYGNVYVWSKPDHKNERMPRYVEYIYLD